MEIIQKISNSKTGLKREVELVYLKIEKAEYQLQLQVAYYVLNEEEKIYLPRKIVCKEFVTTNNRRMLPNATGAISLFSDTEEDWENAIPETLFYDYLIQSNTVSLPDLIRGAILNLDSEKWNWFKEE